MPAPMSTRSASCSTRCWPASRPTPARPRWRSSPSGSRSRCRALRAARPEGAGARGPSDPARALARRRRPVRHRQPSSSRALQGGAIGIHTRADGLPPHWRPPRRSSPPAARRHVALRARRPRRGRNTSWRNTDARRRAKAPKRARRPPLRKPGRLGRRLLRRRDRQRAARQALAARRRRGHRPGQLQPVPEHDEGAG